MKRKRKPNRLPGISPATIRRLRQALGLAQAEFGRAIGVEESGVTVCRWERGKSPPSRLALHAIRQLAKREGVRL